MLSWRMLREWPRHPSSVVWRHPPRSDRITLLAMRFGFLPATFQYQNSIHRVVNVLHIRDTCDRHGERRYYRVACADGVARTLIHDLRSGNWYLQREWFRQI
ncbi:hypothetical protein [Chloroflexus sp.]|uniref:hypothetical protein n=1 Tax=Chloroflexus sp. TaxID=1904827 RepID=UPI004049F6F3